MDQESIDRLIAENDRRARIAGPPRTLTVNGVVMQEFRRSRTWNVPTPAKLRMSLQHQAQKIQPQINLYQKCCNRPSRPPLFKKVVVKCRWVPNPAAFKDYTGVNDDLAHSSSSVENLNPDVAASASASASGTKAEVKSSETNTDAEDSSADV